MTEPIRKLVGYHNFVRNNPRSDKFEIEKFHHIEFWCSVAIFFVFCLAYCIFNSFSCKGRDKRGEKVHVWPRFGYYCKIRSVNWYNTTFYLTFHCLYHFTIIISGNKSYVSFAARSNDLTFVFTAPYSDRIDRTGSSEPHPAFSHAEINHFIVEHGLAVRAVAIRVNDVAQAYAVSTQNGAIGHLTPTEVVDRKSGKTTVISEIKYFGDTVLRWISGDFDGPVLPNYDEVPVKTSNSFGIMRADHIVTNVPKLFEAIDYVMQATGFHEFSEFTAEDVGTLDSGLNSMVLASNNEYVLLPINEPTFGTPRKSQIQNYLEHNNGSGIQHMALKTDNIFHTMREMKKRSEFGGFDFMPAPGPEYYAKIPERLGEGVLSAEQLAELQELGLLADKDDQGVLLQVFTQPIGDRPTAFLEIIQRIGCDKDKATGEQKEQSAGCGGFGKVNLLITFTWILNDNITKQNYFIFAGQLLGALQVY